MRLALALLSMILLVALVIPSSYASAWIRLEPSEVTVGLGGSGEVLVHVGEDMPGFSVRLLVSGAPEDFTVTLTPSEGVTPFTSTLEVSVPSTATPGNYSLWIEVWSGEMLLDSAELLVRVPSFQPPSMSITHFSCPERVFVNEGFTISGELYYSSAQETLGRLQIFMNETLTAHAEFYFAGSATTPFSSHLIAPSEPGTLRIDADLQYYDPIEGEWVLSDRESCYIEVAMPPTALQVMVNGLPENLTVGVKVTVDLPSGLQTFEGNVTVEEPFTAVFEITEPTSVTVMVDGEVEGAPGVKYVTENPTISFWIPPGMTFTVEFNYSTWYLIKRKTIPDEKPLKILVDEKWYRSGELINISAPEVLQTKDTRFVLKEKRVDGTEYEEETILADKPHEITYIYEKFVKLKIDVEPSVPELSKLAGERWIRLGEWLEIPFETIEINNIRYVPSDVSTKLGSKLTVKENYVNVSEVKPFDLIVLKFEKQVLVSVSAVYGLGEPFRVSEKWVKVGESFEEDISNILEPEVEGVIVKVLEIVSGLPARIEDHSLLVPMVTEPGEVLVKLRRFYRVRNYGVEGWPEVGVECFCEGCEWSKINGVLESMAPEGSKLVCTFPGEWKLERIILVLRKGYVGDSVRFTAGEIERTVDKPLDIGAEVGVIKLYELKGYTEHGKFKGEGIYREGSYVSWSVEPSEVPVKGVAGAMGLVWRAVNPSGVEYMDSDKEVKVEWEVASRPPLTGFIALELAAIGVLSLTSVEYYQRWRKMRGGERAFEELFKEEGGEGNE